MLPVGDSLTRGVAQHGSYRPHLLAQLNRSTVANIRTAGTLRGTCVVGKPDVAFNGKGAADATPHEGHCNWDSGALLRHVKQLLQPRGDPDAHALQAVARSLHEADCGVAAGVLHYHTALLLVGHNDVFRVARACRVKERCDASLAPKGHNTPDVDLDSPASLSRPLRCAIAMLRDGLAKNIRELMQLLAAAAAPPLKRVQHGRPTAQTPTLIVGVNPPTGFPCLDVLLQREVEGALAEAQRAADLVAAKNSSLRRSVGRAVFVGFTPGPHTFDTTHPNDRGARLMADGWFHAIQDNLW